MVKLTNAKWFNSLLVLGKLEEKGVLGFAIAQNRKKILEELKDYIVKRNELLSQFGTEESNGRYKFESASACKFFEAIRPYDDMEIEIPVIQVTDEQFCSGNLSSSQMFVLDWMVK